ncbi:hypothetical protein [Psychrobacillus sp. NPDC093180]|uniref:hypothetical protein n=1 Tax=Psychrobacillus sp. NPDC093180 TaxID=3364489 RepID=UPI0037F34BE5
MKKWLLPLASIFVFILMGCSGNEKEEEVGKLTRVDVFKMNEEEVIIADQETIDVLNKAFEQIEWEQNVKAEMSRKEDVKVVLFMEVDKNMPESLVEYFIWFEGNGTATFINRNENSLGKLGDESTSVLKSNLTLSKIKQPN